MAKRKRGTKRVKAKPKGKKKSKVSVYITLAVLSFVVLLISAGFAVFGTESSITGAAVAGEINAYNVFPFVGLLIGAIALIYAVYGLEKCKKNPKGCK